MKSKKSFFFFFFSLFILSIILLLIDFYFHHTEIVPANGGILREGVVGQIRGINPIYAPGNDIEMDLVNLIFSGLMRYKEDGKVEPDIISDYQIEEEGKVYIVNLKKNVFFHDGEKLTADDVVFTIKTIQNPEIKSPLLAKWLGVEVEKLSDYQVKFTLRNPYPGFLENLTLKILPAHIWKNVAQENFPFINYNFEPIGSGPYKFKSLQRNPDGSIKSILLEKNRNYYLKAPFINQIEFLFFSSEKEVLEAKREGKIDAFSLQSFNLLEEDNFKKYSFLLPRYFALFFNPEKNNLLSDKKVRKALDSIIDKEKIVREILQNNGKISNSPLLPEIYQLSLPQTENFNLEKAEALLKEVGFEKRDQKWLKVEAAKKMNFTTDLAYGSKGKEVENLQKCLAKFEDIYPQGKITGYFGKETQEAVIKFQEKYKDEILKPQGLSKGNGRVGPTTRAKLNEVCIISEEKVTPFEITITTANNFLLETIAKEIKKEFENFGIVTNLEVYDLTKIKQEIIPERNYQALLFGQALTIIPDPFPFWHSSQKRHPGLNLSNYQNKDLDKLLENARQTLNEQKRKELLEKIQDILLEDLPAIFICNPNYLYLASEKIKGIKEGLIATPSERFFNIEDWYINTKRSFKH